LNNDPGLSEFPARSWRSFSGSLSVGPSGSGRDNKSGKDYFRAGRTESLTQKLAKSFDVVSSHFQQVIELASDQVTFENLS